MERWSNGMLHHKFDGFRNSFEGTWYVLATIGMAYLGLFGHRVGWCGPPVGPKVFENDEPLHGWRPKVWGSGECERWGNYIFDQQDGQYRQGMALENMSLVDEAVPIDIFDAVAAMPQRNVGQVKTGEDSFSKWQEPCRIGGLNHSRVVAKLAKTAN